MTYYVIRNIDTGEYWRGKGGMWGKYYNQAVIYRIRGQVEFTLRDIQHHDKVNAEIVPIQIVEVKE